MRKLRGLSAYDDPADYAPQSADFWSTPEAYAQQSPTDTYSGGTKSSGSGFSAQDALNYLTKGIAVVAPYVPAIAALKPGSMPTTTQNSSKLPSTPPPASQMSNNTKILIGVGVLALAGGIIYVATKKKKS